MQYMNQPSNEQQYQNYHYQQQHQPIQRQIDTNQQQASGDANVTQKSSAYLLEYPARSRNP